MPSFPLGHVALYKFLAVKGSQQLLFYLTNQNLQEQLDVQTHYQQKIMNFPAHTLRHSLKLCYKAQIKQQLGK